MPSDAKSIFLAAVEKFAAERAAFLESACEGDAELRRRVEALLAAHEQPGSLLDKPVWDGAGTKDAITETVGAQVGPYKLLQKLGEGGMGVVFVAEQEQPVKRRVALKIIKPGMDSAQVLARFEAERQALALMDHTHIARVFDAGTTTAGRPYFVMELVKGVPITTYCDELNLPIRERLELFIPVCQAIQHAHTKGIIHRDIKPSNVLVAMQDGKPIAKVIDFGVAKALHQRLTERTMMTEFGAVVGTLEYMSPEQAELSALDIDTRSDVYALGGLLYELLTGTTPFDRERLKKAAFDEIRRIIREEEPPKPSTRLSTLSGPLAASRKSELGKLSATVKGDLDWIVMKALEKDRTRRYETAAGLARDVEHYLKDEAVEACPPSAGYKLRKFARKHKAGLVMAATIAALLLAGIVVSAWQAVRATVAEGQAIVERDEKEQARSQAAANEQRANANAGLALANEKQAAMQRDAARTARDQLRRTLYASSLNLIQVAWEANNVGRVLELLEQTRPGKDEEDLRGFEWHYWNRLCHADLRTLALGQGTRDAAEAVLSPDGARYAAYVQGNDRKSSRVKVWDVATGKELLSLPVYVDTKYYTPYSGMLAFSQDGKRLAFSEKGIGSPFNPKGPEVKLLVWDLTTGKELLSLKGPFVSLMALSPDGGRVAASVESWPGRDQKEPVLVWDVATGKELALLEDGGAYALTFSPDGSRLAGSRDVVTAGMLKYEIRIWDAATGKAQLTIRPAQFAFFASKVAFSPDGAQVVVAGRRHLGVKKSDNVQGWVFDALTGQELVAIPADAPNSPRWEQAGLVFSHDGRYLAGQSALHPAVVQIFDAVTGETRLTLNGHTAAVTTVAFSPDDLRLYSADQAGTVKIWDATRAESPKQRKGGFNVIVYSPDGSRTAVFSPDGPLGRQAPAPFQLEVIIRDSAGKELCCFKEHTDWITALRFSPDGRYVESYDVAGDQLVWEAATGRVAVHQKWPAETDKPRGGYRPTSFSGGRNIYTDVPSTAHAVFSAGGSRLAAGEPDGGVKVWDLANGKEVLAVKGKGLKINSRCLSPDGRWLVTGENTAPDTKTGPRSKLRLWQVDTGKDIVDFAVSHWLASAFSPDSSRLVVVAAEKVHLWDLAAGKEMVACSGSFGPATFSPNGATFTACKLTQDKGFRGGLVLLGNQVAVWDARTGAELTTLTSPRTISAIGTLVFNPDGTRLAAIAWPGQLLGPAPVAQGPGEVVLWDVRSGKEPFCLQGHSAPVTNVVFSPDGKRLATSTGGFAQHQVEVKLWDALTGKELLTLTADNASFGDENLFFNRDGTRLILQRERSGVTFFQSWVWDATPLPEKR
jgi:WD40 repeat protein/serine/threonine protein kinase